MSRSLTAARYDSLTMVSRIIRLRRPVVISVQEGRFVPPRGCASLDEIDERWEALRASNPAYHDGPAYHVIGVHRNGHGGAVIHVLESSYRFQAVQSSDDGAHGGAFDVGHRGLGVRGMVRGFCAALMGKRSDRVGRYPGMWEFVPAGGLGVGEQPQDALRREMREEIGVHDWKAAKQVAVMFDDVARTWEIVFAITLPEAMEVQSAGEHTDLGWFRMDRLPAPLSPITAKMIPLARE